MKSLSEWVGSDMERLWILNDLIFNWFWKITWFKFEVVLCRNRLFPTLISKIKWLVSELPLKNLRIRPKKMIGIRPNYPYKVVPMRLSTEMRMVRVNSDIFSGWILGFFRISNIPKFTLNMIFVISQSNFAIAEKNTNSIFRVNLPVFILFINFMIFDWDIKNSLEFTLSLRA